MGDARDNAKKKKAVEKKGAKNDEGGPCSCKNRDEDRQEVGFLRVILFFQSRGRAANEPRGLGSCRMRVGEMPVRRATAAPRAGPGGQVPSRELDQSRSPGWRLLRDNCCAARRLRVVSSTVKGCEGTAYCSSESSVAHASAEVDRSVWPELFHNQAIQSSIRR